MGMQQVAILTKAATPTNRTDNDALPWENGYHRILEFDPSLRASIEGVYSREPSLFLLFVFTFCNLQEMENS
jgi:hypothetical protein